MTKSIPILCPPAIETAIRAAVSEIQRRNRERDFCTTDVIGHRYPAVSTDEMLKILRQFIESSLEGLG